jgi:pyruvate dehydrogenase E2 component (dihydrolipoamide acetyltransferase)
MSTIEITVPKLGLTMEEGAIVEWFKADGEAVEKGQPLYSVETDKIVSDVEADAEGFLQRVAAVHAVLPVSAVVGYLHPTAESALAAGGAGVAVSVPDSSPASAEIAPVAKEEVHAIAPRESHPAALTATSVNGRRLASPVARTLAASRNIELTTLSGSGPGGVILKRDVPEKPAPDTPAPQAPMGAPDRQPMTPLRRAISQRMMKSLSGSAQMTAFGKIDMTEAVKMRTTLAAASDALGARITYTDLVLKAAAVALRDVPQINASIDGDDVITWSDVNIGLAVAIDDGLVVPVIHHVDRLTLPELSNKRAELIERARTGRLTRDEVEGASFTLSNFGSYGGDFETPILNPPQSALLGIGQITEEPAVRDGAIVIRSMMSISMTFDHRLIDGAVAGKFRARLKTLMETPALWLATLR